MWNLFIKFDPLTGVKIASRIDAMVQALFGDKVPDRRPTDALEKQRYLAARAVTQIMLDNAIAEFSIPVEIPASVLATPAGTADIHAVVVRNGTVLCAPGQLNLGRNTRLANRVQRRALRGLYRSCSIPGCTVGYDRCKLHHIIWRTNGGTTDLDKLLPVCNMHHTRIHSVSWIIEL